MAGCNCETMWLPRRYTGGATTATSTPATERSKGKARPGPAQSARSQAPKHILALRDFVSLADYIAASTKPVATVPTTFVTVLERAISVRRDHGAQTTEKLPPGPELNDSSNRHNHFIGILEHVWQALRPRMSSDNVKDPLTQRIEDVSADTKASKLANRFEGLDIQEPSEAFLQAPNVTIPLPSDGEPEVDYEAERLHDMEEAYFAFDLLVQDLRKMQNVIKRTWKGYRLGMFDQVSASLMTNTAIDFARHMEEEIQPLLSAHGGPIKIASTLYAGLCVFNGEDPNFRERPGDALNFRTYDIAEALFLLRTILPYKPGHFGTFDRTSDRSKKSPGDRFLEDKQVMMEILSEFLYLYQYMPEAQPHEDEVTRGLRSMFDTHKIPFWLVFACQVFLDILHSLREDVEKGFNDLTTAARVIENSIKMNLKFHANLRIETWPRQTDMVLHELLQHISWWIKSDFTQQSKQKLGVWRPAENFKILKWHPLLCGIWTYNVKARFQDIAITFSNAWGSIMYSAHLYNALRQEKLLSNKRWPDMDVVLCWHDEIFVGDPPSKPADHLKRYSLSMGYSAASFSRNRRQTAKLPESRTGSKGIQQAAPISQVFFDRYCEGTGQVGFSESDVEKILVKAVWERDEDEDEGVVLSMQRSDANRNKPPVDNSARRLTIVGLLETLRNTVHSEAPEFAFDYLQLHRNCWGMLRRLREACDPHLRKIHGVGYLENETQLPFVVGYLFMAAAGTDQLGKALAKQDEVVKSRVMVCAAEVIEELMNSPIKSLTLQYLARQGYPIELEVEE